MTIASPFPADDVRMTRRSTVFIAVALAVFFAFFASGRRLYAIGGNRDAAALNGIAVPRMIVGAFVASGLLSGVAGVIIASQLGTFNGIVSKISRLRIARALDRYQRWRVM